MTDAADNNTNVPGSSRDADIESVYKQLATEQAPAHLNRRILKQARQSPSGLWNRFNDAWWRPAAAAIVSVAAVGVVWTTLNVATQDSENRAPQIRPELSGNDLRQAVGSSEQLLRDSAARAVTNNDPDELQRRVEETDADDEGAGPMQRNDTNPPQATSCSREQRASTSAWWRCIEALEGSGQTGAAERELEALMLAFPGLSGN